MDIISLESGVGKAAIRAAGVLRQGGVILYPTDTVYGLGADALSDDAVAKIYAIKGWTSRSQFTQRLPTSKWRTSMGK